MATDARFYAEAYGVSQEEAERRIALMVSAQSEVAAEDDLAGDDLVAAYFEHGIELTYVVETKKGKKPKKAKKIKLKGSNEEVDLPIEYRVSDKATRKTMKRLLRENGRTVNSILPEAQVVSYNERTGIVTINVSMGTDEAYLASKKPDLEKLLKAQVALHVLPSEDTYIGMRGGLRPFRKDFVTTSGEQKYTENCTLNFAARAPDGKIGYLTAGHCVNELFWREPGSSTYQPMQTREFWTDSGDWQFVFGPAVDRLFKADNSGSYRTVTGRRTQGTTCTKPGARSLADGDPAYSTPSNCQGAANGTFVCWYDGAYGPDHGQQCGEVNANWVRVNDWCGPTTDRVPCGHYWVEVIPKAGAPRFYAGAGDSGSPVFAWNTAFGIVTNSRHYSDGSAEAMWYTSIDDPYSFGYSLLFN